MRAIPVCVLLCSAFILASAAKPGPALLADWMEKQTAGAGPSTTAKSASASPAHYEEADVDWGCFKSATYRHCRVIGCTDYCDTGSCATADTCNMVAYYE